MDSGSGEKVRGTRVLVQGALAVVVSAVGTVYYLSSVILSPLFLVNLLYALRVRRNANGPRIASATYGVALAVGALLMPFVGLASFAVYNALDLGVNPDGSIVTGGPFYTAVFTPAAVALVLPLVIAWLSLTFSRARSEARRAA